MVSRISLQNYQKILNKCFLVTDKRVWSMNKDYMEFVIKTPVSKQLNMKTWKNISNIYISIVQGNNTLLLYSTPIRKSTMVHCRCTMVHCQCTMVHWQCTMVHRQCTMLHFLMGCNVVIIIYKTFRVYLLTCELSCHKYTLEMLNILVYTADCEKFRNNFGKNYKNLPAKTQYFAI